MSQPDVIRIHAPEPGYDRFKVARDIQNACNTVGVARELIRVIEDAARFLLNDAHLCGLLKSLRHELATALQQLGSDRFHTSRDTTGDVNTTVVMTGCPGGVTVERVVQVTSDTLLWIQVRSPDRATANRVLDSVETHGL